MKVEPYRDKVGMLVECIQNGARLQGEELQRVLEVGDGRNANRILYEYSRRFGPFDTAATLANMCIWETPDNAHKFVETYQAWPPRSVSEESRYM